MFADANRSGRSETNGIHSISSIAWSAQSRDHLNLHLNKNAIDVIRLVFNVDKWRTQINVYTPIWKKKNSHEPPEQRKRTTATKQNNGELSAACSTIGWSRSGLVTTRKSNVILSFCYLQRKSSCGRCWCWIIRSIDWKGGFFHDRWHFAL